MESYILFSLMGTEFLGKWFIPGFTEAASSPVISGTEDFMFFWSVCITGINYFIYNEVNKYWNFEADNTADGTNILMKGK